MVTVIYFTLTGVTRGNNLHLPEDLEPLQIKDDVVIKRVLRMTRSEKKFEGNNNVLVLVTLKPDEAVKKIEELRGRIKHFFKVGGEGIPG